MLQASHCSSFFIMAQWGESAVFSSHRGSTRVVHHFRNSSPKTLSVLVPLFSAVCLCEPWRHTWIMTLYEVDSQTQIHQMNILLTVWKPLISAVCSISTACTIRFCEEPYSLVSNDFLEECFSSVRSLRCSSLGFNAAAGLKLWSGFWSCVVVVYTLSWIRSLVCGRRRRGSSRLIYVTERAKPKSR